MEGVAIGTDGEDSPGVTFLGATVVILDHCGFRPTVFGVLKHTFSLPVEFQPDKSDQIR
jgi:hypothetical protein